MDTKFTENGKVMTTFNVTLEITMEYDPKIEKLRSAKEIALGLALGNTWGTIEQGVRLVDVEKKQKK